MLEQVGEAHRGPAGPSAWPPARRDQHQRTVAVGRVCSRAGSSSGGTKMPTSAAPSIRALQLRAGLVLQADADLGMRAREKARQVRRQAFGDRRGVGDDAQMAADAARELGDLLLHRVQRGVQAADGGSAPARRRSARRRARAVRTGCTPRRVSRSLSRLLATASARCSRSAPRVMLRVSAMASTRLSVTRSRSAWGVILPQPGTAHGRQSTMQPSFSAKAQHDDAGTPARGLGRRCRRLLGASRRRASDRTDA